MAAVLPACQCAGVHPDSICHFGLGHPLDQPVTYQPLTKGHCFWQGVVTKKGDNLGQVQVRWLSSVSLPVANSLDIGTELLRQLAL